MLFNRVTTEQARQKVERCRSIFQLDLNPGDYIDTLMSKRVMTSQQAHAILSKPTHEESVNAFCDYLVAYAPMAVPTFNEALKTTNPFLHYLFDYDRLKKPYKPVTVIQLSGVSSLRKSAPPLEEDEHSLYSLLPLDHTAIPLLQSRFHNMMQVRGWGAAAGAM